MRFPLWFLLLLVGTACAVGSALPEEFLNQKRLSPDGRFLVTWNCVGGLPSYSCTILIKRVSDGRVLFKHNTLPRYIKTVWNPISTKCLVLDAPDNATIHLWLFYVDGSKGFPEPLPYDDLIGRRIEAAFSTARPKAGYLTRSGVEKVQWISPTDVQLGVIHNNVSVRVLVRSDVIGHQQVSLSRP